MFPIRAMGFTLAELLIALAILGVIAAFSIPKIIGSQQNCTKKAEAKEVFATVTAAYHAYRLANQINSNTSLDDLSPYFNYVRVDTTSSVDYEYTSSTDTCNNAWMRCLQLHNGGILHYNSTTRLGGTGNLNALFFWFDPDGTSDGTTNGPGKSIKAYLYTNGRVTDVGNIEPSTAYTAAGTPATDGPWPQGVPPWFNW